MITICKSIQKNCSGLEQQTLAMRANGRGLTELRLKEATGGLVNLTIAAEDKIAPSSILANPGNGTIKVVHLNIPSIVR